jgi:hypothetical protein
LDLRRTRSSENLLPSAESTDLGQSLFEIGKPSVDQDSFGGGNGIDSAHETKKHDLEFQQEQSLINTSKGRIDVEHLN